MNEPLISICVPAYKQPQYVVRLLNSVLKQDYKKVEIIISDDSPDEDTKQAIEPFRNKLLLSYYHNQPSLKSPRNWNNALDKANGDLLVLMHQDDWYHSPGALSAYINAFSDDTIDFVFCQNTAIDEKGNIVVLQAIPSLLKNLSRKPNRLVLAQVIGPPGNTMLRKTVDVRYDERFIWLVDVDYYVRLLKNGFRYRYLRQHLVSIGLHEDQTTAFCRANPHIIFKENIWFAKKLEITAFHDILVYDYYWRLLRNYGIRTIQDIEANDVRKDELPVVICHMLKYQKNISGNVLRIGLISKLSMLFSYTIWRSKGIVARE
ncbi:MAG TPA: glycosyltransferase family 2 protein [Flavisolibacter sp.]|nr:glycosyltransferase family 2 protein [Flavisolibacter sp.]